MDISFHHFFKIKKKRFILSDGNTPIKFSSKSLLSAFLNILSISKLLTPIIYKLIIVFSCCRCCNIGRIIIHRWRCFLFFYVQKLCFLLIYSKLTASSIIVFPSSIFAPLLARLRRHINLSESTYPLPVCPRRRFLCLLGPIF